MFSQCSLWLFFLPQSTQSFAQSYTEKIIEMNRKEFIKTTGRILILGGIATSAGYLLINKKVTANCSVSPTCKSCGKISNCENPNVKEERAKNETKTP